MTRVCVVYDCLYPWTVGGAERWYRALAEHLAARGSEVTYLTLRQWDAPPEVRGVRVVPVGPRLALYTPAGRRRLLPPLVFGVGVLLHLARHRRRYDVVHTASFPYFPLLAAALLRARLVVDWHEHWSAAYWRSYLGPVGGRVGAAVQALCARVPQRAVCFSRLTEGRLRAAGLTPVLLRGLHPGPPPGRPSARPAAAEPPVVVSAGRWVPEKRLPVVVAAVGAVDGVRLELCGDGPDRPAVEAAVAALPPDARARVRLRGRVPREELDALMAGAAAVVVASQREGYGLVAVEAVAAGVPVVVAPGPDTAVPELVEPAVNGVVTADGSAEALAAGLRAVLAAGEGLRRSTARWYAAHADELALATSLQVVQRLHAEAAGT